MSYNWLRELNKKLSKDEMADLLPDMLWDIYDSCGLEVLIILLEKMPKVPLYISPQGLNNAREFYVKQNATGDNQRALAMALGISVRKVYDIIEQQSANARQARAQALEFDFMKDHRRAR
ncbi:MAG TPA: hypothetical protein PLL10_04860 [Elusimicrobiales bacterium]|nr:hypothetical protein [Elusimicrobiales bacterium]